MHELMHHAGFSDRALARAVGKMKGEDPIFSAGKPAILRPVITGAITLISIVNNQEIGK
jgi:hypothetical protein